MLRTHLRNLGLLLLLTTAPVGLAQEKKARAALPPDSSVELHAHLFMKEGMGWGFHGGFNGRLRAKDWRDKFSSMANPQSVEDSKIGILVASLYAHPLFTLSMRDSIQRQVEMAREFVKDHPEWVLARNAAEARAGIAQGKRIMILALEGARGIIDNEADLKRFVDEDGIAIVTILHLTDDNYGGVAFLGGIRNLADPFAWFTSLFAPHRDGKGVKVNPIGLSDDGHAMAAELIKRHVWIDLAHASDASAKELIEMQTAAKLPLLYSHTILRRYAENERGISDAQIAQVAASGGIIGLVPSEEYLAGAPIEHRECEGTVWTLAKQYEELAKIFPVDSIAMGSDYNGGLTHLKASSAPACKTGTALDQDGLWNIGGVPALWEGLRKAGAPVPEPLTRTVDAFLAAWDRI